MPDQINVAILEDHQSNIDGYRYRISNDPEINIVAELLFSKNLMDVLAKHDVNLLILDLSVPISQENRNIQPIHPLVAKIRKQFPDIAILVITIYNKRAMIKSLMKMGIGGYILKDDFDSIRNLANIIKIVARKGIFMSKRVRDRFLNGNANDMNLTRRELEVLSMCSSYPDESTAEIADRLNIAHSTVRNFLHKIYFKLEVHGRTAAILKARRIGLIPGGSNGGDN
jgi:DNA-binding NarL/FixJ family response regulator